MAKKLLKNGEMIAISSHWIAADGEPRKLIMKYPQPAGVMGAIERAHAGLLTTEHPVRSTAVAELSAAEEAVDARHDALVKAIDAGLTAAALLTKNAELNAAIAELHAVLLPSGVSIVGSSYLDEVGNVRAVKARLTPAHKTLLKKLPTPESTLLKAVEEWLATGEELAELETKRQAESDRQAAGPSRSDNVNARNKWIRAATALESMVELAEMPADEALTILGQLRATERKTSRRGARKAEDTPTTPETSLSQ